MECITYFDKATWTLTYLVYDPATRDALIIDPVLDFDPLAVDIGTQSAQLLVDKAQELGLKVHYVLDTHAHADHLSAFQFLKEKLGAQIGIGKEIQAVQGVFKGVFNFDDDFAADGSQWDLLISEGQDIHAGSILVETLHTPGHTPACYSYKIGEMVFVGDTLFMPDSGTGRCDFPGGSAESMYDSIQKLFALPDSTRVFVGHDYQPGGREVQWETTIGACKEENIHMRGGTTKEAYVAMRTTRDATLKPPKLIFQSLQVNANGGALPAPDSNGYRYLRAPIGLFRSS
jgi:glyoxylase-like metal-dependent hydrolase (beta-lactamase superfamily II)